MNTPPSHSGFGWSWYGRGSLRSAVGSEAVNTVDRAFLPLQRFLVLLGLTGLAVSQPLLSALGEQPTVFVFNRVSGFGLVVFAVVVAFVPPLVLWALESLVGRFWPSAGRALHVGFVAALVALVTSQVLRITFGVDQALVVSVLALAAGAAAAWAFVRFDQARRFTAYLAPLPVLAVVLFLFASETTPLLSLGSEGPEATPAADVSPVVVLIVDELPTKSVLGTDGGLDVERFPNLARFAEDATLVPQLHDDRHPHGARGPIDPHRTAPGRRRTALHELPRHPVHPSRAHPRALGVRVLHQALLTVGLRGHGHTEARRGERWRAPRSTSTARGSTRSRARKRRPWPTFRRRPSAGPSCQP